MPKGSGSPQIAVTPVAFQTDQVLIIVMVWLRIEVRSPNATLDIPALLRFNRSRQLPAQLQRPLQQPLPTVRVLHGHHIRHLRCLCPCADQ